MDCKIHNKKILFNCEQCNINICSTCVSQDHKGHSFNELDSLNSNKSETVSISEEDNLENCKRKMHFLKNDIIPLGAIFNEYGIRLNAQKLCFNLLNESHLNKKKLIKDKIIQYHKQLDALELEINQVLDNQFKENKEYFDMKYKSIDEHGQLFKERDIFKFFNDQNIKKDEFQLLSINEQYKNIKDFVKKMEVYSPEIQQMIIKDTEIQKEYFKFFEINLEFNDELINNQQLIKYSKIEYQDNETNYNLIMNNIILEPFFKKTKFKIYGGQKILDESLWERVALIRVADIPIDISIPKAKELYFTDGYFGEFYKNSIPNTVTTIYLGNTDHPITRESIPKNLKNIYFCNGYSHDIPSNLLADVFTEDFLVNVFIGDIKFKFPNNFDFGKMNGNITFVNYKSSTIPYISPHGKTISLGELGHPIGINDCSFKKMKLINGFNQILNSKDIDRVRSISFQSNHVYPFKSYHDLQNKYDEFEFKNDYNHPIIIKDLQNILSLKIGSIKSTLSKESISNNKILWLYFKRNFNQIIDHHLVPSSVVQLTLGNVKYEPNLSELKSLKILRFVSEFSFPNTFNTIPDNVEELSIGKLSFNLRAKDIPSNIKTITFDHYFDQDFQPLLCNNSNIETLKLGAMSKRFNTDTISNPLPSNIKNLEFLHSNKFTITQGFISPNVKSLFIQHNFNGTTFLPKSIPKSLKLVTLGPTVDTNLILSLLPFTIPPIKVQILKDSIMYETLGKKFNY